jgi:hypothetical protein
MPDDRSIMTVTPSPVMAAPVRGCHTAQSLLPGRLLLLVAAAAIAAVQMETMPEQPRLADAQRVVEFILNPFVVAAAGCRRFETVRTDGPAIYLVLQQLPTLD